MRRLVVLLLLICCATGQAAARSRFAPHSGHARLSGCRSARCASAHNQALIRHHADAPLG